ncbi:MULTISPECIES: MFS transporter [Pseudothermotoga]|nr:MULTISPECIES: MFS transporter [Pseudothermotoga]HBT26235.1 MFS transporter [Pseudothermotoga sp.]
MVLLILLNADQMVMSPTIGMIEEEFGVSDAQIGLVGAIFTVIGALISLVWGYLADKFNRKNLLLYSVLVGEIPCLMTAFSGSFSQLFLWRALTGIGVGASFPIVYSLVADMFDEVSRGKIVAFLTSAISIGNILGMVIGGFVGPSFGWRIPFVIVSLPNVFLTIAAFFVLKEPKRGAFEKGIGELVRAGYTYPKIPKFRDYAKLVTIKTNLFLFLQGILGTVPWGAIPYFLVEYFRRERGLSVEIATIVFLVFGLGNILGTVVGGWIGTKLYKRSRSILPVFCGISTAAGVLLTIITIDYHATGPGGLFVLGTLGLFAAMTDSITGPNVKFMLINVNEPQDRGRIFSIFNLTDSLGTGVGRWIGGALSIVFGSLGIAMKISAYFWFGCTVFLMILSIYFSKDVQSLENKMIALGKSKL